MPRQTRGGRRKPRVEAIDAARGLAIVLVVVLHANDWLMEAGLDVGPWFDINVVLAPLRMPLFFVVAGVVGSRWVRAEWASLISSKVTLLLWVYLLWQPIGTLVGLVVLEIKGDELDVVEKVASLVLVPVRPRLELWFVWALALSFVIARRSCRVPAAVQLGAWGAASAVVLAEIVPMGNPGWSGLFCYHVFFLLGVYHREIVLRLAGRAGAALRLSGVAVAVWLVLSITLHLTGAGEWLGFGLALRVLGVGAGIALATLLARSRIVRHLGANTLPIYLAHTPLVVLAVRFLQEHREHVLVGVARPVLPVLITLAVVPATLALRSVLQRTPARVLYAPPAAVTARVHAWVEVRAARWGRSRRRRAEGPARWGLPASGSGRRVAA